MPAPPEGIEKLQLLDQLHKDDVTAVTQITAAHQARLPNWSDLAQTGQINSEYVSLLTKLSNADHNTLPHLLRSPDNLQAIFSAIRSIRIDANAVLHLTYLLISACKADTPLWDYVARCSVPSTSGKNESLLNGQIACYKSLEVNWREVATNDNLAYLLTALQSHYSALDVTESSVLVKMILDPKILRLGTGGRLAAISNLLMDDSLREEICRMASLSALLIQGFTSKDLEQMYYSAICLWLLSFSRKVIEERGPLYERQTVIDAFIDMITGCKREKVVRASCHAMKNLIQEEWIFEKFSQRKVDHTLSLLEYEKWRDNELYEMIQEVSNVFYNKIHQYSNFSRYMKELSKGQFIPGPLHTEKFWIENVRSFEDNEFSAISKLTSLLHSDDPSTVALACFDLGEFSRLYPTGKKMVIKIGAKAKIVDLMSHPNKEVAREALLSTQKMMLDDWRKLGAEQQDKHR